MTERAARILGTSVVLIYLVILLSACSTAPETIAQTKVIEVPSAKPYRFITYSLDDTAETRAAVRAHNRAHQAVINAETKAKR